MSAPNRPNRGQDPRNLASRLRQRITIQAPVDTEDGLGGATVSWSDVATVWAEVVPLSSGRGEQPFAYQQQAETQSRITIRYREDVDASMRIVMGARQFNIRSVINVAEANVCLEMIAEEGVAI